MACWLLAALASGGAPARPNVLLIVADDLPRNLLGAYGSPAGLTPSLDRLARDGVVLEHAYTTSPLCTPSRYSLLTGLYASTAVRSRPIGTSANTGTVRQVAFQTYLSRKDNVSTIATTLHAAGYFTGFVGKYHVGHPLHASDCGGGGGSEEGSEPTAGGCLPTANQSCVRNAIRRHAGFDHVADVYYDNEALEAYAHQPEWMALEAQRFLARARARNAPFFLLYAPTLSHSPADVPAQISSTPRAGAAGCGGEAGGSGGFAAAATALRRQLLARLTERRLLCPSPGGATRVCGDDGGAPPDGLLREEGWLPREWFAGGSREAQAWRTALRTSAAYTAWLDASLEPLLASVFADGARTLTVFTADHGPYFSGKGHAYEAGVRVPMLLHWPTVLPGGAPVQPRVTHLDLLPTLAALGGAPLRGDTHGRPWQWLVRGAAQTSAPPPQEEGEEPPLFLEVGYSRAVLHDGWKLLLVNLPPPVDGGGGGRCRTIHNLPLPVANGSHRARVKFLYDALERRPQLTCDGAQLFHLRTDPSEQRNLARAEPGKLAALGTLLRAHVAAVEPEARLRVPTARRRLQRAAAAANASAPRRTPYSWCQSCHPRAACPAWPAEAPLAPATAEAIGAHVRALLARMGGALSPGAVRAAAATPSVAAKCLRLRAASGRLLLDFLGSAYDRRNFSIGSCFPSRHENFLHGRLHTALRLVHRALRRRALPDFDVLLCPDDCPPALGARPGDRPALTSVSCAAHRSLPFVSWIVNVDRATDLSEWDGYLRAMWEPRVPWAAREPKAVFRGRLRPYSYCGGWRNWSVPRYREPITADSWRTLGRAAIWAARAAAPELLDVNFGNADEFAAAWRLSAAEARARDEPNSVSMGEQARRFRYLVHAEGACGSSDRLKQSFGAPLLLLKQAAPCHEWFEPFFRAWEHYVPVDGNFLNLSAAIRWARAHDAEAQRIVAAANARVLEVVSVAAIYEYAEQLLAGYAERYSAHAQREHREHAQRAAEGNFTAEFVCEYTTPKITTCSLLSRQSDGGVL